MDDLSSNKSEHSAEEGAAKPKGWGTRYTFTLLSFLGFSTMHGLRANLSVAIVAMVNSTSSGNDTEYGTECPISDEFSEDTEGSGDFNWDSEEQGVILGAFFYGYIITQIPGGMIAERYGGKWLFGCGLLATSVFTMLTPVAANLGKGTLIATRVIEGFFEGVAIPAMQALVAKWMPLPERSLLASCVFAGAQGGTVISLSLSGVLADEVSWQSVFYVTGGLGCLWFVFWGLFAFDSPETHPRISPEERRYIETNIPGNTSKGTKLALPPLTKIFTSLPFLSLLIVHMAQTWGYNTLLTETPTYLSNIQHFSLKANGFLSALPYLLGWVFSLMMGSLSDYLLRHKKLTATASRKIFQSIGHYGPALGCVWLAFVGCNQTVSVIALCVAVGLNGAVFSGYQVNHVDIAPNYAGTLMGITNMCANVTGFITPYVTGAIINDKQTIAAWRIVFLISAAVYVVGNTIFVIFGTAKVQSWNYHGQRQLQSEDESKE